MGFRLAADALVGLHAAFTLFVAFGGLLVLYRRGFFFFHLPAAVWGFLVEAMGWVCPLTTLENHLRQRAGDAGYDGGFIEHYLLPVLYPTGLTREIQWVLAGVVLLLNAAIYALVWRRSHAKAGLGARRS